MLKIIVDYQQLIKADQQNSMQIQKQFSKQNLLDKFRWYADGKQNMFILTFVEKIKEARLKFSQGSVTVL